MFSIGGFEWPMTNASKFAKRIANESWPTTMVFVRNLWRANHGLFLRDQQVQSRHLCRTIDLVARWHFGEFVRDELAAFSTKGHSMEFRPRKTFTFPCYRQLQKSMGRNTGRRSSEMTELACEILFVGRCGPNDTMRQGSSCAAAIRKSPMGVLLSNVSNLSFQTPTCTRHHHSSLSKSRARPDFLSNPS